MLLFQLHLTSPSFIATISFLLPNMTENTKKRKLGSESDSTKETANLVASELFPKKETPPVSQSSVGSDNKPVFGASSTFGKASMFNSMKQGMNIFDPPLKDLEKNSDNVISARPMTSFGSFGSSFGANTKFTNAFQKASQKKSFLDEPGVSDSLSGSPSTPSATPQQYKQVELTIKEVKTGEENEQSIFSATAKLFELQLSKVSEGWKERGIGPLHLNRSIEDSSQVRIVMRSHGLLRVILNYKITPTTVLIKGLESSLSPGKFLRINSVSADGIPVQYLIKFPDQAIRDKLYDTISDLQANSKASYPTVAIKQKEEVITKDLDQNKDSPETTSDIDSGDDQENGDESEEENGNENVIKGEETATKIKQTE